MFSLAQAEMESVVSNISEMLIQGNLSKAISAISKNMFQNMTNTYIQELRISTKLLLSTLEPMAQMVAHGIPMGSGVTISAEILETVRKMEPLVPEENREEFEELVALPNGGKEKLLTLDKICKLVSLIAAIVTIFYYTHDMALKISENKQKQADDDKKQAEIKLREDELELAYEFFEYIKENGICVPGQPSGFVEQVEPFGQQTQVFVDSAAPDEQANDAPYQEAVEKIQN